MEDILCTGCNFNLGSHVELYRYMEDIIKKQSNDKILNNKINAENLSANNISLYQTGDLMTSMHVTNECCRKTFISMTRSGYSQ